MKFLVTIKINNIEVSKGYGRNKKSAKYAATQILLQLVCPNIYREWAANKQKLIPEFCQDKNNAELQKDNHNQGGKNAGDHEMNDESGAHPSASHSKGSKSNKENMAITESQIKMEIDN